MSHGKAAETGIHTCIDEVGGLVLGIQRPTSKSPVHFLYGQY